ncbi:MAG: disulfide bond formation protein DsbA [Haloplasmataceae bacterium]|jgi:predicted DsbA family dithiol-disulfide isomerase|nr:disulfide bond formation protein DsbA [Haloplasmataceae bacterium]
MKIEIWSDFICPFCYIGKRRLEEAIKAFQHKDQVEVIFKSFQLDPDAKLDTKLTIHEILAKKYGTSIEQAKKTNDNLALQAANIGLKYNYDQMKYTNTFDAHRLAKYAETKGKAKELNERLFKAYFTESLHIGKHDTLINLAKEVGLDDADSILNSDQFNSQVSFDITEAREIGVEGVPFFVFNRKYAISGAQPLQVFTDTLQKVWKEENHKSTLQKINTTEAGICTDDGCEVPVNKK